MRSAVWDFRNDSWAGRDLAGYKVVASDGEVGKVDARTDAVDHTCIVVDTGPWIFGRKVVLPVGLIDRIDDGAEEVHIDRPKAEIEDAPEYDEELFYDEAYRETLRAHYERPEHAGAAAPGERDRLA